MYVYLQYNVCTGVPHGLRHSVCPYVVVYIQKIENICEFQEYLLSLLPCLLFLLICALTQNLFACNRKRFPLVPIVVVVVVLLVLLIIGLEKKTTLTMT